MMHRLQERERERSRAVDSIPRTSTADAESADPVSARQLETVMQDETRRAASAAAVDVTAAVAVAVAATASAVASEREQMSRSGRRKISASSETSFHQPQRIKRDSVTQAEEKQVNSGVRPSCVPQFAVSCTSKGTGTGDWTGARLRRRRHA